MPNALTVIKQAAYLEAITAGQSRVGAAGAAGVSRMTAWKWAQDPSFAERVEQAEGRCEQRVVERIVQAIDKGSWRAGIEFLQRRFPDRWRAGFEITADVTMDVETRHKTEADLRAEISDFAAIAGHRIEFDSVPALQPVGEDVADVEDDELALPPGIAPSIPPSDDDDGKDRGDHAELLRIDIPDVLHPPRVEHGDPDDPDHGDDHAEDQPFLRSPGKSHASILSLRHNTADGWVTVPDDYRRHFAASIAGGTLKTVCENRYPVERTGPAGADQSPCETCRAAAAPG